MNVLYGKYIKLIKKSHFIRNIAILMSGAAIAQIVVIIASPLITRLYDPKDFGVISVFVSVSTTMSMVASLRYDVAIVLPDNDKNAVNVFALSCLIVLFMSLLSAVLVFMFGDWFVYIVDSPDLMPLLWLISLSILCDGMWRAFSFWSTRLKNYKYISISQVSMSTSTVFSQWLAGLASLGSAGLVGGKLVGQAIGAMVLIVEIMRKDWRLFKSSLSIYSIVRMAKNYGNFPKYNAPQTFLSTFSQSLPPIFLSIYFGPMSAGYYWLTNKMIKATSSLIGNSVRSVFYQKVGDLSNRNEPLYQSLKKVTLALSLIGAVPVLLVLMCGPDFFAFVFGEKWHVAGKYAQLLVVAWFFYFINVPSVMLIPIIDLQHIHLIYEIAFFVFKCIAIPLGAFWGDAMTAIAIYSFFGTIFNLLLICFIHQAVYKYDNRKCYVAVV